MASLTRLAMIFSALGNERRLHLLNAIEKGISNPGELAKHMELPRSTVEKHIRVLLRAELVEKVPGLGSEGQLRVSYNIRDITRNLLEEAKKNLNIEE